MPRDPYELLNECFFVSHETFARLKIYHDLLLKWQAKINLISDDTVPTIWSRHFLDSIQLAKFIPGDEREILDVGSGAGFPGMVLSICGIKNISLIESDAKKISFLNEVARLTSTDTKIIHDRAENIFMEDVGVIMARALSELRNLFETSSQNVSHETICLFPKGKNYAMEIEDAKKEWQFNYDIFPSVTDANAVILRVSNLQRRKNNHGENPE
jgi:16S rRNA (guanine527-N7)-methyltransferase